MVMVVKCESCRTGYRLNEALLKGAKGAAIRCPRCGERIIVMNPQAPPVPPRIAPPAASPPSPPEASPAALPTAVETGTPAIGEAVPWEMTSPVPGDRPAGGADLSELVPYDPVDRFDDGIVVSPTPGVATDPPDILGRQALRLEELFIDPSAVEKNRIPGGGEFGPMAIESPGPGWKPPPVRPLYRRPLFLAAAISIPLLAGGVFFFVDGNSGRTSSDNVIPVRARSIPEKSVFDVGNVKGFLMKNPSGEPFYVVKGTVTNIGKALSTGIRIEAALLGKDNQVIVRNGTFAGNMIDESLIPHMRRVRIEGFLGMPHGEGGVNRDIPAGKTLPFMVVFFDPPEGVESFRVQAIDPEEVDRIDSPDGKKPGRGASNQQSIRLQ